MKASALNLFWEHKEIINLSPEQTYESLLDYYKQSSKSFTLDRENFPMGFSFHRGSVLFSACGFGSELWCRHYVDVNIQAIEEDDTQILWNITLKLLFGLQYGKNAIS